MARIRTIKPEFPQSESIGRISRDARLLFIQMWTLADDSGRLRGSSRMLASLLFPYDDDAPGLISTWMEELERENCILRYTGQDGSSYVSICNWANHQKIDKPSESKLPAPNSSNPRECSRIVVEPSRKIVQDQGPRTKDQGEDQGEGEEAENSLALASDPKFQIVWKRWKKHRIEKQKPLGAIEEDSQLMDLSRFGSEAIDVVEFSIRKGALNLITNGDHRPREPTSKKRTNGSDMTLEEAILEGTRRKQEQHK